MMDSNSFLMASVSISPIGKAVMIVVFVIFVYSAGIDDSVYLNYTVRRSLLNRHLSFMERSLKIG